MTEVCCQFGEYRQLAGILTEPTTIPSRALILINAGLIPKLGPFRLYVDLARRLARDGIATLRFDLGGIGDSRQELTNLPLRERTHLEIAAAVAEVRRRYPALREIVLGGLCSGAEDALRFAEREPTITGVVMIDPFAYRTSGWEWRHVKHRITRRALRAAGVYEPVESAKGDAARVVRYKYMERAESSRIVNAMLARNARLHFVYTGGQHALFNHPGQLQKMFPNLSLGDRVTLDFFPHLDHTQLLDADRREVVTAVGAWMTR